ncbi:DUF6221 family protein [Nonomuraea sp. NPDC026600]|uniref:DUF6221 family protein n=1 Tax=Nonomuraea sp. NPDC026600 TaxID=3155363 RepID=UPI0033F22B8D
MSDLLSWLKTTIEGDLAAARAADEASPGPWVNTGQAGQDDAWQIHGAPTGETEVNWDGPEPVESPALLQVATLNYSDGGGVWEREAADHIVLQQPRDTIARCLSELAIVDEMIPTPNERLLRLIAAGYQNRPGWRDEWHPTPPHVREWLAGSEERRKQPLQPDNLDELQARLDALKAEGGPRCLNPLLGFALWLDLRAAYWWTSLQPGCLHLVQ